MPPILLRKAVFLIAAVAATSSAPATAQKYFARVVLPGSGVGAAAAPAPLSCGEFAGPTQYAVQTGNGSSRRIDGGFEEGDHSKVFARAKAACLAAKVVRGLPVRTCQILILEYGGEYTWDVLASSKTLSGEIVPDAGVHYNAVCVGE